MSDPVFSVGDVVKLKSGGPNMTISTPPGATDQVTVIWFNGADVKQTTITSKVIDKVEPTP